MVIKRDCLLKSKRNYKK